MDIDWAVQTFKEVISGFPAWTANERYVIEVELTSYGVGNILA